MGVTWFCLRPINSQQAWNLSIYIFEDDVKFGSRWGRAFGSRCVCVCSPRWRGELVIEDGRAIVEAGDRGTPGKSLKSA
jgi:hypothetical protein